MPSGSNFRWNPRGWINPDPVIFTIDKKKAEQRLQQHQQQLFQESWNQIKSTPHPYPTCETRRPSVATSVIITSWQQAREEEGVLRGEYEGVEDEDPFSPIREGRRLSIQPAPEEEKETSRVDWQDIDFHGNFSQRGESSRAYEFGHYVESRKFEKEQEPEFKHTRKAVSDTAQNNELESAREERNEGHVEPIPVRAATRRRKKKRQEKKEELEKNIEISDPTPESPTRNITAKGKDRETLQEDTNKSDVAPVQTDFLVYDKDLIARQEAMLAACAKSKIDKEIQLPELPVTEEKPIKAKARKKTAKQKVPDPISTAAHNSCQLDVQSDKPPSAHGLGSLSHSFPSASSSEYFTANSTPGSLEAKSPMNNSFFGAPNSQLGEHPSVVIASQATPRAGKASSRGSSSQGGRNRRRSTGVSSVEQSIPETANMGGTHHQSRAHRDVFPPQDSDADPGPFASRETHGSEAGWGDKPSEPMSCDRETNLNSRGDGSMSGRSDNGASTVFQGEMRFEIGNLRRYTTNEGSVSFGLPFRISVNMEPVMEETAGSPAVARRRRRRTVVVGGGGQAGADVDMASVAMALMRGMQSARE